jgi:hypothetical protein
MAGEEELKKQQQPTKKKEAPCCFLLSKHDPIKQIEHQFVLNMQTLLNEMHLSSLIVTPLVDV